jgi:hypothetical protein
MLSIVEPASVGGVLEPEEAVARGTALIDGLDMHSVTYKADVAALATYRPGSVSMAGVSTAQPNKELGRSCDRVLDGQAG